MKVGWSHDFEYDLTDEEVASLEHHGVVDPRDIVEFFNLDGPDRFDFLIDSGYWAEGS